MKMKSLAGNFLIASPVLDDPNFSHTVVLMCHHTEEGAFGLVVNRVLMESFQPLLNNFDFTGTSVDMPVFFGGPVKPEQGYIIFAPFSAKYGSMKVGANIGVTASREMLFSILNGITGKLKTLGRSPVSFNKVLAKGAKACLTGKTLVCFHVLLDITKSCDCAKNALPIICPDLGYLLSRDPVAIEAASIDMIIQAAGPSVFRRDPWEQVAFAEKLGLGRRAYELVRV